MMRVRNMTSDEVKRLEQLCESAFPLALDPCAPGDAVAGRLRGDLRREAHRLARARRWMTALRWGTAAAAAVALMATYSASPDVAGADASLVGADVEVLQDFIGASAQSTAALQRLIADDWMMLDTESPDVELDAINEAFYRLGNVGA